MPNPLGQSFAPMGDEDMQNRGNGNGASPVQEAIRTLTTRLPRTIGAGAIAPGMLLNSPGASGLPGGMPGGMPGAGPEAEATNPLLDALRRILGGTFAGGNLPGGASIPAPHVIPGVGPGEPAPGTFNPGGFDEEPPMPPLPPPVQGTRPPRDMGTPVGGINGRGRAYQQ
jgi:hypothetical protein